MSGPVSSKQYIRSRPLCSYNSAGSFIRKSQPQVEDSDDENSLGPPKLSNFGSALLTDKENETPTYLRRAGVGLQTTTNGTKPTALTETLHTEDGSHSTLFTSHSRHQPSMTTVQQDNGYTGEDGSSSHRYQLIQQSIKDEISTRQSMRRSRRFITSRLSSLGPAKRNPTLTTNFEFSSNVSHDDSRDISQAEANIPSSSNNNSSIFQNQDYNVFLDTASNVRNPSKDDERSNRSSNIDYGNISFGDLNPYQYLRAHNLPTSELSNISKAYFEIQKKENRRAAVRKNIFAGATTTIKENINSRSATPQQLNCSTKSDRQPRRKPSDASVSSFSKILSSPMTAVASSLETQKQGMVQRTPPSDDIAKITQNIKKREALNNIDINAKQQQNTYSRTANKKHKPDEHSFHHRKAPNPPSVKKVEIVEPVRDSIVTTVPLKSGSPGPEANYQSAQKRRPVMQVNGSEYEKVELLGRGGSSKVYKVRSSSNKIYALKRVSFDEFDDSSIDGFKGEIELLKKLENQTRVVKLIDHEMTHGVLYVVMECGDHDLSQVLAQRANMPLDIEFVRYHAQEMLKCVKVVHDAGIVHSDLKPANFVFVKGILKIIDFGIANAVPDHTVNIYRDTQIGTPNYMAPEALVAMNYTNDQDPAQHEVHHNRWKVGKPSDIWSCGCIIYQMIYGRPPYGGFQGQNRLLAIMNPDVKIVYSEKTSHGDVVPRTALDTIKACLERNPDKRWTVEELLDGPFINPVAVTRFFIRDLIKNAVKYGSDQKFVSKEKVEDLADDVWNRLSDFRL